MNLDQKLERLKKIIEDMGGVVIGFSGGVDSTFLLKVAAGVLKDRALGVIATSSTYPERELHEAKQLAGQIGACIRIIETEEDKHPKFVSNPTDRCYYCKSELFSKLVKIAREENMDFVADGSNIDDEGDFRPGMKALAEIGVRSPLREAGLNKTEIRDLSKRLGLPTHDKPSFACLSSRFPYGSSITPEKLKMVDAAENYVRELGFRTVRVRHYDTTARIELDIEELPHIVENQVRGKIVNKLKEIGYIYITIDLEGFRSGSMNEVLSDKIKRNNA
ncbi:ATP-dependent sacrificial sulfur transferase LarE [candidate division KSB1 bacterium]